MPVHSAGTALWCALNEGVLQTLMIPLAMVMHDKLRHRSSEVTFPDRNDPVETLLLHRPHEPLRVCIRVRSLIGCPHHANPRLPEPFPHGHAPLRVPIA